MNSNNKSVIKHTSKADQMRLNVSRCIHSRSKCIVINKSILPNVLKHIISLQSVIILFHRVISLTCTGIRFVQTHTAMALYRTINVLRVLKHYSIYSRWRVPSLNRDHDDYELVYVMRIDSRRPAYIRNIILYGITVYTYMDMRLENTI